MAFSPISAKKVLFLLKKGNDNSIIISISIISSSSRSSCSSSSISIINLTPIHLSSQALNFIYCHLFNASKFNVHS